MDQPKQIALIFLSQVFNNADIIKGIASYERIHCDWNFYLDDQAIAIEDPAWLFREKFDGLICRHAKMGSSRLLQECIKRGIPCVSLDVFDEGATEVPSVTADDYAIGKTGGEYFLSRGYQNFAYCGFKGQAWARLRKAGFRDILNQAQFSVAETECELPLKSTPAWDFSETRQLIAWIKALPKPVAIMASNDLRALQAVGAARKAGLLIPEEVAVLGSGNDSVRTEVSHPPLSSVSLNTDKWGYKAAEALHRLMEGKSVDKTVLIEPREIVVRRSTDAVAIEDDTLAKAFRIIKEEKSAALTVEDLAKRVGLSRSLLERRFRKYTRKSPQEAIRLERINQTKEFLLSTEKTLAEIAETLGFTHPEYLSVMFKRLTGETARSFRTRHRKLS